jgi:NtrC-family two-component system response regulator AlgB
MLPENQLENELFGQMYGGSTGTVSDKPGRLKAADGGTVFLEEISNMAAAVQAKFLRFVEEQTFECVGGEQAIRLHLRIIVASSRDLAAEVAAHRFREDLYYRLSVITLQVPALHERTGDILRLATQMLSVAAARYNRPELRFSPDASFALVHHRWPGNLRELRNVVERAAVLCPGEVISAECLPDVLHRSQSQSLAAVLTSARLDDVEREHIIRVMAASRTLEDAANRLGINLSTLWRRRKRYGLDSIAIASKQ